MKKLDVAQLFEISIPVLDRFATVEPKPWDRKAIMLELLGELGSLSHEIQYWEGTKRGSTNKSKLCDECSDVLLIIIRLAREDHILLPAEIDIPENVSRRSADLVLGINALFSKLMEAGNENDVSVMIKMLQTLSSLSLLLGIDLTKAHKTEMDIANGYFEASGEDWPKPNAIKHPIKTYRLRRLVKKRRLQ